MRGRLRAVVLAAQARVDTHKTSCHHVRLLAVVIVRVLLERGVGEQLGGRRSRSRVAREGALDERTQSRVAVARECGVRVQRRREGGVRKDVHEERERICDREWAPRRLAEQNGRGRGRECATSGLG